MKPPATADEIRAMDADALNTYVCKRRGRVWGGHVVSRFADSSSDAVELLDEMSGPLLGLYVFTYSPRWGMRLVAYDNADRETWTEVSDADTFALAVTITWALWDAAGRPGETK
jgi:hypothetical protein